ncbi:MAG: hypothetical protein J4F36_01750 [Nitrosopumilaceae archaeon]|nr:hypothetical protein [Nitrosopumilaceae archaeon]
MKVSKVDFSSLLTYTPRGKDEEHFRSRSVMRDLKNDVVLPSGNLMSTSIANMIKRQLDRYPFSDYFNENTLLVPTPKSTKQQKDELWVPQRIVLAMANNGLGKMRECLSREIALPRSSTSLASDRPKAKRHYESMKVKELLDAPREIVLVDYVITRGATTLGAVNRLADAFPNAKIRVFAAMRTISNPDEFSEIIQPCIGTITLLNENTWREP